MIMIQRKHILISGIALGVLGGYLVLTCDNTQAKSEKISPVVEAPSGIGALGRIDPRSRVIMVSHDAGPEGARIGSLEVTEGQLVKKGDVIAYFSENTRKKAELNAAKASIEVLSAKLKSIQAEKETATREYERYRKLRERNIVSETKEDEAKLRINQAEANVLAAKAEIEAATANLALAEEKLKQTILCAPIDGTILKIRSWPGERVGDSGVVEIADLSQMDVVAEVYERDISKVREGQSAQITVPGMADPISGKVREIGFQVRKNDVNNTDPLADRDNRVVEVRISVPEEKAEALRHLIYMQVNVRIML